MSESRWEGIDEFVAVAECGQFTAAAERLGVSSSHISRQVARLEERLQTRLILQVHDELVLEVPEAELTTVRTALPPLMTRLAKLSVPLVVEVGVGNNWGEAH